MHDRSTKHGMYMETSARREEKFRFLDNIKNENREFQRSEEKLGQFGVHSRTNGPRNGQK